VKLFYKGKDGGPESTVTGYWLIEWKGGFSIALLRFEDGSREAFHNHAFNAISWLLSGKLVEETRHDTSVYDYITQYVPSLFPILTNRERMHKVSSIGTSWAITFRGPWSDTWEEYLPQEDRYRTLTNGRVEVDN
jgi:hypothetical protein